ncbi:Hypothetical predicted protein [Paramuricea clavata]|uniref:Uncharacterized protein n=1 Tax=Paramuricea clavata TaxID=317549 RepID=A0A7D9LAC6_PARCT|nr:Hypothetical predicted protein [Paramuricea clavata]
MAVNSVVNDGNTNNYTELDLTLNVNSTYIWQKYGKYLECCEDRRVKWLGDLTYLKDFVSSLYNVGKWNSPGGSAKCFRHDQICLTWYANKKFLLFQGEEGNKLKDLIIKCYKNSDLAHDHANTCEQEPIVLVNNSRRESPNECQNCSRLFAEMTEVNRKIDGLHEIVNNLYQLNTKFVNYEYSRNDDKRSTCDLGTQTDLYSEQSVVQHPSVIQTADINLATEIEGLKLDFVIIESKTARDLEANRQAIEQLRGELATVGEKIRCSQGYRVLPNNNAKEKLNYSTQLSFQTPINVHANHGNSNSIQPCITHSPTNCAEKNLNYSTQPSAQTSTMCEANHSNLTQRSPQPPTIDHNVTNTCEIGNSSRMEHINTIAETEPCAPRSTTIAEWIDRLPLVGIVQSKFSTESRPFFRKRYCRKSRGSLAKQNHREYIKNRRTQDWLNHLNLVRHIMT